jgi:sialic acid synthase SpsE
MKSYRIGKRWIGPDKPCFIVAEIGINHDGGTLRARRLIYAAKCAGADAVKFQVFTGESRPKLYNYRLVKSQYEFCKRYANGLGLIWFATPFDVESVKLLQRVGVPCYKVSHGDSNNIELLRAIRRTKKPLIVSIDKNPFDQETNFEVENHQLHCVGEYPTPWNKTNLKKLAGQYYAGYSSHTTGIEDCIAARALGAYIIEKHLKLAGTKPIDNAVSITPNKFKEMVGMIRNVEKGL